MRQSAWVGFADILQARRKTAEAEITHLDRLHQWFVSAV
jgi:hypothetical protein